MAKGNVKELKPLNSERVRIVGNMRHNLTTMAEFCVAKKMIASPMGEELEDTRAALFVTMHPWVKKIYPIKDMEILKAYDLTETVDILQIICPKYHMETPKGQKTHITDYVNFPVIPYQQVAESYSVKDLFYSAGDTLTQRLFKSNGNLIHVPNKKCRRSYTAVVPGLNVHVYIASIDFKELRDTNGYELVPEDYSLFQLFYKMQEDFNKEIHNKLCAYKVLIEKKTFMDQLIELWPEAALIPEYQNQELVEGCPRLSVSEAEAKLKAEMAGTGE